MSPEQIMSVAGASTPRSAEATSTMRCSTFRKDRSNAAQCSRSSRKAESLAESCNEPTPDAVSDRLVPLLETV